MTRNSLSLLLSTIITLGLLLISGPTAYAGNDAANQSTLGDRGAVCSSGLECKSELRCKFDGTAFPNARGALQVTNGGTCQPAYQNDGDDCYQFDCNRRIGMFCNEGSPPRIGSSLGECKPKQALGGACGSSTNCQSGLVCDTGSKQCVADSSPVATNTSWTEVCGDKYITVLNACIDAQGKTCNVDSDCSSDSGTTRFTELICNTAYTNLLDATTTSGRTGQCRLKASVGGACEEAADCVSGLSCNTTSNTCVGTGSAGAGTTGTNGGAGATTAATGNDTSGRPLFGLQWFRNSDTGVRTDSPSDFLTGVARTVTGILALILVILILTGGVFMMTAAGNEKRYSFGKDIITYAIVGIVIVSAAYIIAELVIRAVTA